MKAREVKAARVRMGYSQKQLAEKLGITLASYRNKENGHSPFKDDEKIIMARELQLTLQQVNDYFFDGMLPSVDSC